MDMDTEQRLAGFVAWQVTAGEAGASAQGKAGTVPSHCAAAPGACAQGADDVADGEVATAEEVPAVLDMLDFDEKEE